MVVRIHELACGSLLFTLSSHRMLSKLLILACAGCVSYKNLMAQSVRAYDRFFGRSWVQFPSHFLSSTLAAWETLHVHDQIL